ncbi:hypothetical protein LV75_000650 [Actinokineospora diospyrosa]|uniref:Uncharacterized protein n=1 Tax=Actinokineospora diospyrosa TaxID=103728 RepID=A0ABT1I6C8_9PSEU|nr:hypothetical protein [Actinokineospora diospyrosa]
MLQSLFEAVSLSVAPTDDGAHVTISVRLPGDTLPEIISTAETINTMIDKHETPGQDGSGACGCCTCPRCDSNAHWTDFECIQLTGTDQQERWNQGGFGGISGE